MNEATQRLIKARVKPTRRPVMYQDWNDLFFMHREYDARSVQSRLPRGLEVDCFEGRAYLGVVGFRMHAIRPIGLPAVPSGRFSARLALGRGVTAEGGLERVVRRLRVASGSGWCMLTCYTRAGMESNP
jgi:uncharacterized protein YqjF (DUF2071 family)